MILLGIDTCGAVGTLALARAHARSSLEPLGSAELPGRSTAAMLVPELGRMLAGAGVSPGQIEGLVVVDGPGSFTGIRIGIATAKALAEACSLPVFAISRLRVLARQNRLSSAALDAGRGEVFFGCYAGHEVGSAQGSTEENSSAGEWLLTLEEMVERLAGKLPEGIAICEPKLGSATPGARLCAPPTAADALLAALPDVLGGRRSAIAELDGRYLRRSDLYRPTLPL